MPRIAAVIFAALAGAIYADLTNPYGSPMRDWFEDEPCVTDSQCFKQCMKEKGRPCTEEEVFGPANEDDSCRPDDTQEPCGERA